MLRFADRKLYAEHKLKGGGVPSPEGLQLNPPPLPYGKSWRVRSKPQVRICKSQICRSLTPLKSPPSAPAHSARPPQKMQGPGFCDFQKTLAVAERAEKKLFWMDLDVNLHQKCKLQDASFMILGL
jgi:hypothetical protein